MPWAQIRGGGGGTGGDPPPPRFFRWGTQYQMSPPPPPPRFGGRMNFGRYNVVFLHCFLYLKAFFAYFLFFFFFFLHVRNVRDVGWVPLHILTCATFDADGAPEKSVGVPPLISFFGTCATFGAGGGREKCVCPPPPPPTIRFGFAPLTHASINIYNMVRFLVSFDRRDRRLPTGMKISRKHLHHFYMGDLL